MNTKIADFSLIPPDELFKPKKKSISEIKPEKTISNISKNDNFIQKNLSVSKNSISNISIIDSQINLKPLSLKGLGDTLKNQIPSIASNIKIANVFSNKTNSTFLNLPPRNANALTGSQFIENTKGLPRDQREKMILNEVLTGNVPDFARNFKEITLSSTDSLGQNHTGKIKILPDYVSIGSNDNFIRIPMDPMTAQKIANKTGTMLPTKKLVNDIYKNSTVKLTPQPLPAGSTMMSSEYYQKHNAMVENQRISKGYNLGEITSGHQKDLVITNLLDSNPKKVAIYGWHQQNGKAIQPLSTIHEDTYADYSHGVRLINQKMTLDGKEVNVADVLNNPELAKMLSDEGVIKNTKIRIR
ncbi:MAG: hypothetical protein AABZ74_11730 [Cyanobacteriota bacterium]